MSVSVQTAPRPTPANTGTAAAWITGQRAALAQVLAEAMADDSAAGSPADAAMFEPLFDHIAAYLGNTDGLRLQLFCGNIRKRYRQEGLERAEQVDGYTRFIERFADLLTPRIEPYLDPVSRPRFSEFLGLAAQRGPVVGGKPLKVMLVGDCFFLDVLAFLETACGEDGIEPDWIIVDSKNPPEARNRLRAYAASRPKAVFYSPFTYEYALPLRQVFEWRGAGMSGRTLRRLVDEACREVDSSLAVLGACECPVFVQNTAMVRRHDGSPAERVKNTITWPCRRRAGNRVQQKLQESLDRHNTAGNLFPIDERPLLRRVGDRRLGQFLYYSAFDHFATLGAHIWPEYLDRLHVVTHLLSKKLLVCDLDDTLWHGLIGEGEVRQDPRRQGVVRRLRERGVVLAVNSKNDPAKVNWSGCLLKPDDFVAIQINWDPKPINMQRIQKALNLKAKDFVFIDDRADQRELVRHAMPEVHTLDATDERSWRLLELWADLLTETPEMDRTQMYRQREQREQFLGATQVEDPAALFSSLNIHVDIHPARDAEVKRAAELINRTNQFNLTGARTTQADVARQAADPAWRVLVVESGDKFGSNGVVAIVVAHITPQAVEIPAFVLSCRVFGYGIETAVINHIKRTLRTQGQPLVGRYVSTAHNQPCREFYPNHGFTREGEQWVFHGDAVELDPPWLTVRG